LAVARRRGDDVLLIEPLRAAARIEPHLRQQRTLALMKFRVRGATIGGCLSDARIGLDRLADGVDDRKRLGVRRAPVAEARGSDNPNQY
jgi:hypothetical protein